MPIRGPALNVPCWPNRVDLNLPRSECRVVDSAAGGGGGGGNLEEREDEAEKWKQK